MRLLSRLHYDTRGFLRDTDIRVLVVHSRDDEIVSFAHAQALLEAAGDRGRLLEIRGDHNTGFLVSGPAYLRGLETFISEHLPDVLHPASPDR